jgi:hypothetical protein
MPMHASTNNALIAVFIYPPRNMGVLRGTVNSTAHYRSLYIFAIIGPLAVFEHMEITSYLNKVMY